MPHRPSRKIDAAESFFSILLQPSQKAMMKTNAKLPSQFYSKSRRKLTKRCATWGRRLLFAGLLLLVFQLVRYLYAKPGLSYVVP